MSSEPSASVPPVSAQASPCTPWGFWASVAWGAIAVGAWFGAQVAVGFILVRWYGLGPDPTQREIEATMSLAFFVGMATILAAPVAIAVIAFAVRLARCRFGDYLAMTWPRPREFVIGIVTLMVLMPLGDLVSNLSGREVTPEFVTGMYRSARDAGVLPLFALAVIVAAPVVEEIVFRGFLLPGLAASRAGAAGAILITSAAWAAMHLQYEFFYIVHVFVLGLAFGWLRWRSGSTSLVIVLHALVNLLALMQAAYLVERMA